MDGLQHGQDGKTIMIIKGMAGLSWNISTILVAGLSWNISTILVAELYQGSEGGHSSCLRRVKALFML